jgi:uncharacterized hydrophobic protein (TIGR00271 family)
MVPADAAPPSCALAQWVSSGGRTRHFVESSTPDRSFRSQCPQGLVKNDRRERPTLVSELTQDDIVRMRSQLFFEGPDLGRRLSRYWLLLPLSAVIAAAGVVSDSTATVIGAMIVAPLMTPILGLVLSVVLGDRPNFVKCLLLLLGGAAVVVGLAAIVGLFVPYPVVAATSSQVAARISPRIVDLVAALATGAVGSVALARADISDTLPGVAIAISLVPPLAVVGLTLESGAPHEAVGALLLFVTNVVAILASGIVVMALYRVGTAPATRHAWSGHPLAYMLVGLLLIAVVVPLWINSNHFEETSVRSVGVEAVADHWADDAGWSILGVTTLDGGVLIDATGPAPAPSLAELRDQLNKAGLDKADVRVHLIAGAYVSVPR